MTLQDDSSILKTLWSLITKYATTEIAIVAVALILLLVGKPPIWLLKLFTRVSLLWGRLAPAGQRDLTAKLGEAYLRRAEKRVQQQPTAALDDIEDAISHLDGEKTSESTRLLLAESYYKRAKLRSGMGNRAAIASDLEAVIALDLTAVPSEETFIQLLKQLADIDLEKAVAITKKALDRFPGSKLLRETLIVLLRRQGDAEHQAQHWDVVIQVCTDLIGLEPQVPEFYQHRANAKRMIGDFKGAIEDGEKLLERAPDSSSAYLYIGLGKLGLGEYSEAEKSLTKVIDSSSERIDSLAYYGRAEARLFSTDYNGAAEDFTVLIDGLGDQSIAYYQERAQAYYRSASYDQALKDLTHVIDEGAATALTLVQRGDVYRFRGDQDSAITDYGKAMSLAPEQYNPEYGYGLALVEQSRALPEEAVLDKRETLTKARTYLYSALTKAKKQAQEFSEFYRILATVEDDLGGFEAAANLRLEARRIELGKGITSASVPFFYRWEAVKGSFSNPKVPQDLGKTLQEFIESTEQKPDDAQEHYGAGLLLLKKGDRSRAVHHLNAVIRLQPDFADGYYWRAWSRAQGHDWLGAVEDTKKATALTPGMSQAYWLRGVAYNNLDRLDAAIDELGKAIEYNPKFLDARRDLVWTLAQKQEWQKLIEQGTGAIDQGMKNEVIYALRAEAYRMTAKPEESVSDSNEALALAPGYALAYRTRGFALLQQEKLSEALVDLNQAIEHGLGSGTEDAGAYAGRAVRRLKGKLDEAMTDVEEAIKLAPDLAFAYHVRAWVHYQKGEWERASNNFSKAIDLGLSPEEAKSAYYGRGECLRMKREWDAAIRDYTEALNRDANLAPAYYGRGLVWAEKADWDAAIDDYSKAKGNADEKILKLSNILIQRSWAYYEKGLDEESVEDLRATLDLDPHSINAHLTLGNVLSYKREYQEAISQYTKVIELDPQSALGYGNRGVVRTYSGELQQAIEDLTTAIGLHDSDPTTFDARAWARVRLGKWEEALADCEKALELNPHYVFALMNRSLCKWWIGKRTDTLRDLNSVLEIRLAKFTLAAPKRVREDSVTWGAVAEDWTRALQHESADGVAYFGRGISHWMARNLTVALDDLTQSIALAPELTDVARVLDLVRGESA